jgi:hypothetical protein
VRRPRARARVGKLWYFRCCVSVVLVRLSYFTTYVLLEGESEIDSGAPFNSLCILSLVGKMSYFLLCVYFRD